MPAWRRVARIAAGAGVVLATAIGGLSGAALGDGAGGRGRGRT